MENINETVNIPPATEHKYIHQPNPSILYKLFNVLNSVAEITSVTREV